ARPADRLARPGDLWPWTARAAARGGCRARPRRTAEAGRRRPGASRSWRGAASPGTAIVPFRGRVLGLPPLISTAGGLDLSRSTHDREPVDHNTLRVPRRTNARPPRGSRASLAPVSRQW